MAGNFTRSIIKMRLNIRLFLLFVSSTLTQVLPAQEGDYLKIRPQLAVLGCGDFDTVTLLNAHRKLIKLDTNTITANKNEYFKDLAWSYYKLAPKFKDSMMMENAIHNFRRAWQLDNTDWMTLGNLCNALAVNKHCDELGKLAPQLKAMVPRKSRKDINTNDLLKTCTYQKWWFKN